jgi:hypothetical protein
MTERVKFVSISRTISDSSGIHYLDAIDENGIHWTGQMEVGVERWITWKEQWKKNNQQPYDL